MSTQPLPPPAGLRDRVLSASLAARPFGRAVPAVDPAPPVSAFRHAADRLGSTLDSLAEAEWRTPAIRGLDVQRLVGHLTGVESDLRRALTGDPGVASADHVESTQPAADRQAGRSPADTLTDWRAAVESTLSAVAAHGDLSTVITLHRVPLPLGDLLIGRSFELWAHENDVRKATGRPPSVPDAPTLRAMAILAATLLPVAVGRRGRSEPVDRREPLGLSEPLGLRLVLTGPGGGAWDLPIGQRPTPAGQRPTPAAQRPPVRPDLLIVADVVDFCRLVSNRVAPGELAAHVTGHPADAELVFTAAASLALD